jgi:hypothetical protein
MEFSVAWCLSIPVHALPLKAMQYAETYFGRMLAYVTFMSACYDV